jgi:radical SAM protein with 4Fe4S-binding SPASM domain
MMMPDHEQVRRAVETIIDRTAALIDSGRPVEILTVDNAADGPYLYLRMRAEHHPRAEQVRRMLEWNGGARFSSGVGIANIDFLGNVHPDQFSMHRTLGNVRQRPFSEIWQDESNGYLAALRDRLGRLTGRCGSCRFQTMCGGSLRARAEAMTGDPWASDPACYLADEQIGAVTSCSRR